MTNPYTGMMLGAISIMTGFSHFLHPRQPQRMRSDFLTQWVLGLISFVDVGERGFLNS